MEPTPHPLTLTVDQAAKVLGIGRSTAYELVHTGAIPSLRLGRRIVVPTARLAQRLGVETSALRTSPESSAEPRHRPTLSVRAADGDAPPETLF